MAISRKKIKSEGAKESSKPVKGAYDKYRARLDLGEEVVKYINTNNRFMVINKGPVILVAVKIIRNIKEVFDKNPCMIFEKVEEQEIIIPVLIYLKDETKSDTLHRSLKEFGCVTINIQSKDEIEVKLSKII